MVTTHNLGFPRIGTQREMKFALEHYWQGKIDVDQLTHCGKSVRDENWRYQSQCDYQPVGDFSFYDHVLDMSFLLGNIPERISQLMTHKMATEQLDDANNLKNNHELDNYFRVARGRSAHDTDCSCIRASEMTKWFDTNYHFIVPEVTQNTRFSLNANQLLSQLSEAKEKNINIKPVIIGPVTYLWLSKEKDDSNRLHLLDELLNSYVELLNVLSKEKLEWVQIDEPILTTELSPDWARALLRAYQTLSSVDIKLMVASYFGRLEGNISLACELPVAGLHVDAISGKDEVGAIIDSLPTEMVLSLGVINGRNIWKTDLNETLDWLEPIALTLKHRLWLAPSCSLLHVPVDLSCEENIDKEVKGWLAFAVQKLDELSVLKAALNNGRAAVKVALSENADSIKSRRESSRVRDPIVRQSILLITQALGRRGSAYSERSKIHRKKLNLPNFPTTTIGSFPQTQDIRMARLKFKKGELDETTYVKYMKKEIERSVRAQESLGLDVLVHGEAERNDMVEYFGEQLEGYVFSQFGWVQSYGSRCVKPPILFGDIKRPKAMTVEWTKYAQSLTEKPMKGMLTGPVTILNWSFVRDDQPRRDTCFQLALAIREEVLDLEKAGVGIIQIDEAALREGLPLRRSEWASYLDWAVESFRLCANGVSDTTQIHTHMCYSEFNDIMDAIAKMDADVITIETSRSDMELLDVFDQFKYPNEIGPGVYDIHSPNIPSVEDVIHLMTKAAERIPKERLWINPDCGLKTRQWQEVIPALKNMVQAAATLRDKQLA